MSDGIKLDLKVPLERFTLELSWETGERWLGIFGHSGAGKTTVLETLAGLRSRATGLIRVFGMTWLDSARGVCLPPEGRGVGYVPQDALLFPHRNVLGNLLAGAWRPPATENRRPSPERVMEVLELTPLRDADVADLSGGEKQRVALGRALCSGPRLLLMDEPFAGLDLPLRRRILPYLLRVQEEFALPTLYVSHDATEMKVLSREVAVLAEGRVLARGRPDEVFLQASILPMVLEEGFENVQEGTVREAKESGFLLEWEPDLCILVPKGDLKSARKVVFGLRAEDILLALRPPEGLSAQNVLPGVVRGVREELQGGEAAGPVLVSVATGRGGRALVASITRQALSRLALQEGVQVHLVFKAQSCRVLAAR